MTSGTMGYGEGHPHHFRGRRRADPRLLCLGQGSSGAVFSSCAQLGILNQHFYHILGVPARNFVYRAFFYLSDVWGQRVRGNAMGWRHRKVFAMPDKQVQVGGTEGGLLDSFQQ